MNSKITTGSSFCLYLKLSIIITANFIDDMVSHLLMNGKISRIRRKLGIEFSLGTNCHFLLCEKRYAFVAGDSIFTKLFIM